MKGGQYVIDIEGISLYLAGVRGGGKRSATYILEGRRLDGGRTGCVLGARNEDFGWVRQQVKDSPMRWD